jgi:hypothetical protein
MNVPLPLVTIGCAELFLVMARAAKIIALEKRADQRTAIEQKWVERGLARELVIEFVLLVPSSAALAVIILPPYVPYLRDISSAKPAIQISAYGLLGIASYGFPFATIRAAIRHLALRFLAEFAAIANKESE